MIRFPLTLVALASLAATAAPAAPRSVERVERVVILMRHGVRPPTKDPAMPPGVAADPWPTWPVAAGELTPHGAAAIRQTGVADRRWLARAGLLVGAACPAPDAVRTLSDSDQRTIATGEAYLAGFAPGCHLANRHHSQGEHDPLFAAAGEDVPLDPARADAAVLDAIGPGGIAAYEAARRPLLDRIDHILCGTATSACGVADQPTALVPAHPDRKPKLSGALDRASTAAQILLLEYAEGKPMGEVGWGHATAADVAALGEFHSDEFALLARPPYLAARNIAPIARALIAGLGDAEAPRITLIVGHDTNVASLGGLLDLHWRAPGYAADDPPPGGALVFERVRDGGGRRFVRVSFRAQALDQLRGSSTAEDTRQSLPIAECDPRCPLPRFQALIARKLADAGLPLAPAR